MASLSVVIASDTFKGSASSRQVDDLLAVGIHRVVPNANTITFPIADGGEGTMDALVSACGGEVRSVAVSGPLGGAVNAHYALIDGGDEAVIEMAEASGITFIDQSPKGLRWPWRQCHERWRRWSG